jgi:transcriptional regulator with XRE-family HTH domain
METKKSIRSLLGITQEEAAQLLGVTRSQFSLYELGKRDLPVAAKLQLVAMWSYIDQQKAMPAAMAALQQEQQTKIEALLAKQLVEQQYKEYQLKKKIARVEKRYQSGIAALMLVEHLKNQDQTKMENPLWDSITNTACRTVEKNGLHVQEQYKIKLQGVQQHLAVLQQRSKASYNGASEGFV